ncbi:MAG: helicase-exonuclease AddAB subunit AddB [Clostridia bacterium]|nr:helicase-exonuclease AddAB subunit AddB [Clostridia bacterium]
MIKFYLGRSGVGKSYRMLEEIKKEILAKQNDKLFLIVPEQYTLQGEMDLIQKMDLPGLLDFEVISFNRLINRVIETLGGLQTTSINTLGKTMLLRRIFNAHQEALTVFARAHQQYGFLEEVSETIAELKRAGVGPELLLTSAGEVDNHPLIEGKLRDLGLVFEAYQKGLSGKYTDDEDRINHVLEVLPLWQEISGASVWIDGFSGFTAQEYQLIQKMATLCDRVTIALTTDISEQAPDSDIFQNSLAAYQTIKRQAEEADIPCQIEVFREFRRSEAIGHLEGNFFAYPYSIYVKPIESVQLRRVTDKKEELEWIGSEIVHMVLNGDYQWKDIMVAVSDVETKAALIDRVFKQYHIPYFIDMKRDVLNNSFIRFVQNSLQSMLSYFRQRDVLEVLKSGYIGLSLNQVYEMENYALKMGYDGRKWLKHSPIEPGYLNHYFECFMTPLSDFYEAMKRAKTVKAYGVALLDYLDAFKVVERIQSLVERFDDGGQHELALEYAQIWNKFIDVIDQLVEITGDDTIELKDFIQLLDAGFREMELGVIPPKENLVTIGSINRSKSHEVKALFLTGMNDGEIPKMREEYGLLSNDDKHFLLSKGVELKSTMDFRNREELFNLYQLLSKPSCKIYFSYCYQDEGGKPIRPSIYVEKLTQIFRDLTIETAPYADDAMRLLQCGKAALFNEATTRLKHLIDGQSLPKAWLDVLAWMQATTMQDTVQHILDGYHYTNQVADLPLALARDLYEMPLTTSTSKLEKYVTCPFSFFIRYGLNPQERPCHEVKMPDIGLVFHEALERFGRKLFEQKLDFRTLDETAVKDMVTLIVDEFIEDYGYQVFFSNHANRYLVEKIKRVVRRAAWTTIRQLTRGNFEPRAFEVTFSDSLREDTVPPIIITAANGEKIMLEGRIDRVDILRDQDRQYVKIIDYKSSNKAYGLSDVYHGLQMQLMIYMDAVLENSQYFKADTLYPCGAFYFRIDDPIVEGEWPEAVIQEELMKKLKLEGLAIDDVDILAQMDEQIAVDKKSAIISVELKEDGSFKKTSKVVTPEDFMALIDRVKFKISEIGAAILDGNIDIAPADMGSHKSCDYCTYKGICQFDQKISGNYYKAIRKYSDEEVLEKIKTEGRDLND